MDVRLLAPLLLAALVAPDASARAPLTFEERVEWTMRVEAVLDARRSAPENREPKVPLAARVERMAVAARVERDLMGNDALATFWNAPIGAVQLQAEMRRLARQTRDPELLREMLAALGNDPYLVAEVIARPAVARRELANRYPRDPGIHFGSRARAEALRAAVTAEDFRMEDDAVERTRYRVRDEACGPLDDVIEVSAEELAEIERRLPPCGEIGHVEELEGSFRIRRLVCDGGDGLSVEALRVPKVPLNDWMASLPRSAGWRTPGAGAAGLAMPPVTGGGTSSFHDEGPLPMQEHTAVWSGSEMLVFGQEGGHRYDPATDTWRRMSTLGAPEKRWEHVALWTGTEMVVWGGEVDAVLVSTGGRYDPVTDAWQPTSIGGAPSPRVSCSFVWTGSVAILFGGVDAGNNELADGFQYDPTTDAWTPTATGPRRAAHSAVWTGTHMIIWGGGDGGSQPVQTGSKYSPTLDTWTPTSLGPGAPSARSGHHGVWTGSLMLVWGGTDAGGPTNTGARYDPVLDGWSPMSVGAGVPTPRRLSTAVWSGLDMIVWGGSSAVLENTGGRYDPVADDWSPTSTGAGVAAGRDGHTAVWTGSEMMIWGGRYIYSINTGGRYDPRADSWAAMSTGAWAPTDRRAHTAVWTGVEMIVFGGWDTWNADYVTDHGRYAPATDTWEPLSTTGVPGPRAEHVAVWTGTEMIVHGSTTNGDGGRYDPSTDSWRGLPPMPVEPVRGRHTAIWSGTEMIVFGGAWGAGVWNSGARFDPVSSWWTPTRDDATTPWPRNLHTAVWTGSRMVVWGGGYTGGRNDGGIYDPATDAWQATTTTGAPLPRYWHTAVWSGTEMLVWGGFNGIEIKTGARYDPGSDTWQPIPLAAAPEERYQHTAVWTGSEMVVWGGNGPAIDDLYSGGRYDPITNTWQPTTLQGAPLGAQQVRSVWTGKEMIVTGYGDRTCCAMTPWFYVNGGRYEPAADRWNDGWGSDPPLGESVLAGKPSGAGSPFYGAGIRGYRVDGDLTPAIVSAFPEYVGYGVRVAAGDVSPGGSAEVVAGAGPGPAFPPLVRGFDRSGVRLPGFDVYAYGTTGGGANVGVGKIDFGEKTLTGPGPSAAFGPHVRAFRYTGSASWPLTKVSFYAYGTLKHGVNVAAGDLDGDGFEEIVTGAGPGAVFGPHVRGFDYDANAVAAMPKVSFFAYGTLRYGVEVGAGDVDGDGYGEILTGPGPAWAFPSQLRGFDYDGTTVAAMSKVNAIVFPGSRYGMNVAAGDLDTDGYEEIACGAGPDPVFGTVMAAFDHDGATLAPIAALGKDVYGLRYGVRVACGAMGW